MSLPGAFFVGLDPQKRIFAYAIITIGGKL